MLTGEKKKLYQRNYMRDYMRNKRALLKPIANKQVVKTLNIKPVKTQYDADGNVMYDD